MSLIADKLEKYEMIVHGEEVPLSQVVAVFSACWIYHSAVEIDEQTVCLFNIENHHDTYCSLILSLDKAPMVTKRTTADLMKDYEKGYCEDFKQAKQMVEQVYGKKNYLTPYISKHSMMIPLEGESKGNVDYVNLSLLNSVTSYSSHGSVLTFCDFLEIVLPRSCSTSKKRLTACLEYYVTYYLSLAILNNEEETFIPFEKWLGSCCENKEEHLIFEAKKKVNRKQITFCKILHELRHSMTAEAANQLLTHYYDLA